LEGIAGPASKFIVRLSVQRINTKDQLVNVKPMNKNIQNEKEKEKRA